MDYLRAAGRLEGMRAEDYIFAPLADPLNRDASGKGEDWNAARHVTSQRMRETLKTFGRLAGIPDEKLSLMALGHTAVMLRLEAGDSVEQIQAFLKRASLKSTRRYLSLLPTPSLPKGRPGDGEADLPTPPQRKSNQYQPGDNFRHGYYARNRAPEEIAAMVAQDIQGMGEEIAGLRDLGRLLIEMQRQAVDAAELAALIDIYSLSAVRLGEMVQAQKEIQERRPEDSWAEQLLAVLVESARRDGEDIDIDTAREMALASDADAQSAALRLMEEIAATRLGLRRAYHLVMQSDDVHDRIHLVDIYGRACHRLSRLLKMDGVEHSRLEAIMNDLIDQVTAEVAEEFGLV